MEYMTASELTERYHITPMSLHRWIRDENKKFPQPVAFGRRRLFKREEIEAWERDRAKGAA
ncbi:helix-turn-helix domain-containing protein [Agrobacterium tumefaciens]|uniref:DNA-binding transcriptional regulator AlpA n=3 Tax=Agrobacterium TaxID=357 RepID=A0AAJ4N0U0_AGRTU|nr:putative DNA-binding transcriptional regulator AlpA [Agrobacterium tumefaciens]MDR6700718.1 putative DNA-binding transcriptional regulator AlpA [Agrobacterium tumefaciens]QTG12576.1 helix-turn-helix domain-containing protein [Agrobacterium tumefaciens]SDJ18374.1 Helix-turn-helix domain-containing protein [Agrobacterium fabrum]